MPRSLPIALIAMDLDGTMIEPVQEYDQRILPDLLSELRRLSQQGVICVTATGRKFSFQTDLFGACQIGPESQVIRAIMCDEREIFVADNDAFRPLVSWNDPIRARWNTLFPITWDVLEQARTYATSQGWEASFFHAQETAFSRGLPTIACDSVVHAQYVEEWINAKIVTEALPFQTSRNLRRVQIIDGQAGKGAALQAMTTHFDINPSQVLAIGDSHNDVSMLDGRYGFRSATVGNAETNVKDLVHSRGGYVATKSTGNGILEIIASLLA